MGLTGLLMVFGPRAGDEMVQLYDRHLSWTSKLLPLFYVPALAVLPALLDGMPGKPPSPMPSWCVVLYGVASLMAVPFGYLAKWSQHERAHHAALSWHLSAPMIEWHSSSHTWHV